MVELTMKNNVAIFGGGCFWCTEAIFKELKGVISVMPGYAGGSTGSPQAAPTYEEVCGGKTGHAEVVRIEYNPEKISFRDLLTVFFATHDPTTRNRQGADIGTQYRSIIFYTSESQKNEAERFINEINASLPDGNPAVTELKPLDAFYGAEDYHRDYYRKNPKQPYCELVINPKLQKVKEKFTELLKKNEELSPELYRVARQKGTEAPFTGRYWAHYEKGMYQCTICGAELFSSDAKFDSGTGWPSFTEPANLENVELREDLSGGMRRTEVLCKKCGAHLGHVFDDGPKDKGGKRYCVNSICLKHVKYT